MDLILKNKEIFPISGRRQLSVDLLKADKNIFSMLYDVPLHTARLESNGARRVFMIYKEGKRQPKFVLKNEYGFDVGIIDPQQVSGKYGCVRLYGNTYYYNLDFVLNKTLSVFNVPETPALLTVKLDSYAAGISNLPDDYYNFLLGGLCWYLQLPVKAEILNTGVFNNAQAIRV